MENSWLAPLETRNQLRMLLEMPSSLWSGTSQEYAQNFPNFYTMTLQNLEISGKTVKLPQPSKNSSKQGKGGEKVDTSWFSRVS